MDDTALEKMIVDLKEFTTSRYFGKYRGRVEEVDEEMGRITATVPEVYGEEVVSPWAMPSVPFAGKNHGLVMLPEKEDGVWIEFEAGDPSRPIWTGCWWASGEMPSPGKKKTRVLVTSGGLQVVLDDTKKEIKLTHPGGGEIKITDKEISLKIGSADIKMTSSEVLINKGAFKVST